MAGSGAEEYHDKDFEWDDLREEVEKDASMLHHVAPPSDDVIPFSLSLGGSGDWRSFHLRHSTGRFFKVLEFRSAFSLLFPLLFFVLGGWGTVFVVSSDSARVSVIAGAEISVEGVSRAGRARMSPSRTGSRLRKRQHGSSDFAVCFICSAVNLCVAWEY